jgi:RecA-family ATPase
MVAICMAVGHPCLGKATTRARVLFFSGEDPEDLVLRRIRRICRALGIDPQEVHEQLHVIDATEFDPVLFFERRQDGTRAGTTTPTYAALASYVEQHAIDFVIVDNASDVFDGDEINRTLVRSFIRALVRLVRPRNGAVLLLAHVDKGTSRAGKALTNTEAYSGSTAWHNSARSRLFLLEKDAGVFELQHQKCNLGPKQEPLLLDWPKDGVLQLAEPEQALDDVPARAPTPKSGNQKLVFDALGPLLRASGTFGRAGAPPMCPCITVEQAVEGTRQCLTCEPRRQPERVRLALTGLANMRAIRINEGWLWLA